MHNRRRRFTAAAPLRSHSAWPAAAGICLTLVFWSGGPFDSALADEGATATTAEARLSGTVSFLASDELEGRGIGLPGLDRAADYIAEQFEALGLKTDVYEGSPFQRFQLTTGSKLGEPNRVVLVGPAGTGDDQGPFELEIKSDYSPLALGSGGAFDLPLVFVGYGITAPEADYDDYAGIDAEGKAVIVLRHEPEQANPDSAFEGTTHSRHAPFARKLANAYEHGAAAVVFCTDLYEIEKRVERRRTRWDRAVAKLTEAHAELAAIESPTLEELEEAREQIDELAGDVREQGERMREEYDPVLAFDKAGEPDTVRDMQVLHCARSVVDRMIRLALDTTLADLEAKIDEGPTPHSVALDGWRIEGLLTIERELAEVRNVVGILEGAGPDADETIVIGAHYDHLGYGGSGSLAPHAEEIHNGADDNASGTAALIEVARRLVERPDPLGRRIVFIAFTAEERGLIGSAHYVRDPAVPVEKTVAMLNMDMVGRLTDNKLIVQGHDTAQELGPLLDDLNERYGFEMTKKSGGYGPSDHSSFYAKKVPVLHFFTGTHKDYHRPSDDVEKVNVEGMRRIAEMVAEMAVGLADAPARPEYQEVARSHSGGDAPAGDRPYFGSIPDFAQEVTGYALMGVTKDGPAEKAGLAEGDVIIRFGDSRIGGLEDFDSALRKFKAGDKVRVVARRGDEEKTFEVTLDPPR